MNVHWAKIKFKTEWEGSYPVIAVQLAQMEERWCA